MDPSGMDGISTKRLDYLPIIGQALRRLGVRELVDGLVPRDPRTRVSTGECVEALIVAILHGKHTLYRIDELLAPYDLELAFGWTGDEEDFHDDRVGRALAETFEAGLMKLQTAAIVRAVQAHELDLRHLHLDTSSVSFYGQYLNGHAPEDPESPQAIPHVTRGHSKDYRADLKQVIYGLAVSGDGGVPIFGRVSSGNRSDSEETRWLLKSLAEALPDPSGATLVGDSKFFSGETLLAARSCGFHVMTMLPRNVSVWGEAYTAFRAALTADSPMETLKVVYPETLEGGVKIADTSAEPFKEWRGCSFDLTYRWTDETTKQEHELPLRALVVESTTLRDQKIEIVHARRDKEAKALAAVVAKYAAREFNCEGDAHAAVPKIVKKHGPDLHRLKTSVVAEQVPVKRPGPGRPRADEERTTRLVWRVVIEVEHDPHDVDEAILRESCFVLVTTSPRSGPGGATDNELFRRYQEQNHVEAAFRTFKNPLEVAPVFLKTETRVAALGLVYVLALMTYVLIQRDVRRRLAKTDATFPGNKGFTAKPTTEVIFRLFEGIDTLRFEGREDVTVTNMTTAQHDALVLLHHPMLKDKRVRFGKLREPKPRRRGARSTPRPRPHGD